MKGLELFSNRFIVFKCTDKLASKLNLQGTGITIESNLQGTDITIKRNVQGTDIAIKRNVQGTDIAIERNLPGTDITMKRNVQGTDIPIKRNVQGTDLTSESELELAYKATLWIIELLTSQLKIIFKPQESCKRQLPNKT